MTPKDLRESAAKHASDAQSSLDRGDFDKAAYDAGFCAELALKARYCSRNALLSLPTDKKNLKFHKLNTHDLNKLLQVSESVFIAQASMKDIDWKSISDWENEDRYKITGQTSEAVAKSRVEQTTLLIDELIEHEVVEALERSCRKILAQGIDIGLLTLTASHNVAKKWVIQFSSLWLDDPVTRKERTNFLGNEFLSAIPVDLRPVIVLFEIFGREDDVPRAFYNLAMANDLGCNFVKDSILIGANLPAFDFTGLFRVSGLLSNGIHVGRAYVLRLSTKALFETQTK